MLKKGLVQKNIKKEEKGRRKKKRRKKKGEESPCRSSTSSNTLAHRCKHWSGPITTQLRTTVCNNHPRHKSRERSATQKKRYSHSNIFPPNVQPYKATSNQAITTTLLFSQLSTNPSRETSVRGPKSPKNSQKNTYQSCNTKKFIESHQHFDFRSVIPSCLQPHRHFYHPLLIKNKA